MMAAPYADLRDAIARFALKRRDKGDRIIISETTDSLAQWMFDFRALMLQPTWLNRYAEIFWERYESRYPFQVGGIETAGIPLVAAVVMKGVERGTPVNGFYLRKSRKRHDLMRRVEGTLTDEPIVFVDDLINNGNTLATQVEVLRKLGKTVSDIFVLLAFRDSSAYAFAQAHGIRLAALFALPDFGIPALKPPAAPRPDAFNTRWHYEAPEPSLHLVVEKSAPALDRARLYFGCDDGKFRALDQETGAVCWEFAIGPHPDGKAILSSPAIHDGAVYFGAYDGNVYALEAATGALRWKYAEADWIGSSPALAPDLGLLFIGLEFGLTGKQGGIAAVSLESGTHVWLHRTGALTHGSPCYIREESMVAIGSNDGVVYAYDARSGALRWRFPTGGDIKSYCAYDPVRRLVLANSMDGKCYALSARDGAPAFAYQTGGGLYSAPLVSGHTAYAASLDKRLYAIDLDSGLERWHFGTRGRIFAAPALLDDSLWIGSNDGCLYELDPASGAQRHFFQATERVVNAPVFNPHTKRLFVPTYANEIYCLERNPELSSRDQGARTGGKGQEEE